MGLGKDLETLLEGIRAEVIALRKVRQGIETSLPNNDVTERALILADTISYQIWGGSRGWERATDKQFEILLQKLKERLRANTDERVTSVQRDNRVPGEYAPSSPGNSQPVDDNSMDETL